MDNYMMLYEKNSIVMAGTRQKSGVGSITAVKESVRMVVPDMDVRPVLLQNIEMQKV